MSVAGISRDSVFYPKRLAIFPNIEGPLSTTGLSLWCFGLLSYTVKVLCLLMRFCILLILSFSYEKCEDMKVEINYLSELQRNECWVDSCEICL